MTVDEGTTLTDAERRTLAGVADHLIPAAHGMPSAAEGSYLSRNGLTTASD